MEFILNAWYSVQKHRATGLVHFGSNVSQYDFHLEDMISVSVILLCLESNISTVNYYSIHKKGLWGVSSTILPACVNPLPIEKLACWDIGKILTSVDSTLLKYDFPWRENWAPRHHPFSSTWPWEMYTMLDSSLLVRLCVIPSKVKDLVKAICLQSAGLGEFFSSNEMVCGLYTAPSRNPQKKTRRVMVMWQLTTGSSTPNFWITWISVSTGEV